MHSLLDQQVQYINFFVTEHGKLPCLEFMGKSTFKVVHTIGCFASQWKKNWMRWLKYCHTTWCYYQLWKWRGIYNFPMGVSLVWRWPSYCCSGAWSIGTPWHIRQTHWRCSRPDCRSNTCTQILAVLAQSIQSRTLITSALRQSSYLQLPIELLRDQVVPRIQLKTDWDLTASLLSIELWMKHKPRSCI